VARSLQPVGIFEIFTHQDGLDLPSIEEQREEAALHIEDALQPVAVPVVRASDTLQYVSAALSQAHAGSCLVRLADGSWYAMGAEELTSASATLTPETPVQKALKTDRTPLLFPDMPLDSALHYFPRWPLLPVLNRASRGRCAHTRRRSSPLSNLRLTLTLASPALPHYAQGSGD